MTSGPSTLLIRLSGLAGVIAVPQLVLGVLYASSLRPGFNQFSQVVSELDESGTRSAAAFELFALIPFALLLGLFALGLHRSLPDSRPSGALVLGLGGVLLAVCGVFPCDQGCPIPPVSWAGFAHTGLAVAGLVAIGAAPLLLAPGMDSNPRWRTQWRVSVGAARLATLFMSGFALASFLQLPIRAVLERGLVLVLLGWILLTALHLLRRGWEPRPFQSSFVA